MEPARSLVCWPCWYAAQPERTKAAAGRWHAACPGRFGKDAVHDARWCLCGCETARRKRGDRR